MPGLCGIQQSLNCKNAGSKKKGFQYNIEKNDKDQTSKLHQIFGVSKTADDIIVRNSYWS